MQACLSVDLAIELLGSVLERSRGERAQLAPNTRLNDLAIESLELVDLFIALEDETGLVVSVDAIRALKTVADIASVPTVAIA